MWLLENNVSKNEQEHIYKRVDSNILLKDTNQFSGGYKSCGFMYLGPPVGPIFGTAID